MSATADSKRGRTGARVELARYSVAAGQPASACYGSPDGAEAARPYALFVLTVEAELVFAITWFGGGHLAGIFNA